MDQCKPLFFLGEECNEELRVVWFRYLEEESGSLNESDLVCSVSVI